MVDVDPVPAGDGSPSPAGSGPDAVAGALRAADARARMGVRRHPVVPAAILSGLAVQAVEIATAINRGLCGDLDRPLIRALADGLDRDLDRAGRYAVARNLQLGTAISRGRVPARVLGQARYVPAQYVLAVSLAHNFGAAVGIARELGEAIDAILGPYLDLRLTFSRDHDLEQARELADAVGCCLGRAGALAEGLGETPAREQVLRTGRVISRILGQALEYTRAMDRVCAQGLAGRLGITTAQGLAQAVVDGGLDDFTSADLTCASLVDADLTGVHWSLTGTAWPPGTDIGALLARSQAQPGGVLVLRHRGMMWQPTW